MTTNSIVLKEIQNQKELTFFFNTINSLPEPKKRSDKLDSNEKIPVILSADDNYSCFVSTTGCSILYNTNSFIEFYVLSEGISDKNKELIRQSFANITPHFSLEFVECDSEKDFSKINILKDYHVKLNTCNRLLVPKLIPNLKRAIYLDVDLIFLDDIKKLWDEDLDGHIFGCVPLLHETFNTLMYLRNKAKLPDNVKDYYYLNSGVMLIDYDKWREKIGNNKKIIENLFDIIGRVDCTTLPDEIILNKFAYENGGYKRLDLKYNTQGVYIYEYLKRNKKLLLNVDKGILSQFEKSISYFNFEDIEQLKEAPVVHHFYGSEKPWNNVRIHFSPSIPSLNHFSDFWFYAKMTPFFTEIEKGFLEKHMYNVYDVEEKFDNELTLSEKIFSIKNLHNGDKSYKVITILGLKIKFKKKNK